MLSIPNYLPSRQGKSLDFELASLLIRLCKSRKRLKNGEGSCCKQSLQKSDTTQLNNPIFIDCEIPEYFEKESSDKQKKA
jgi:hypothetical protein